MKNMETVTDGIAPRPRPTATAFETYAPLGVDRWLNGVKWTPWGCPKTTAKRLDDECLPIGAFQAFVDPTAFDAFLSFRPFRIETAFTCSVLGGMGVNGEKLQTRAEEVTRHDRSRQLALQVLKGTPEILNPKLVDATDVSTSDITPVGALAAIENGLADRTGNAQGMIHMEPGMLARLYSGGGLVRENGQFYTASGHLIVADAGYRGTQGLAGQSWLYGSGTVRFATSSLELVSSNWENFNFVHDDAEAQVEQYAIAAFETCSLVRARSA